MLIRLVLGAFALLMLGACSDDTSTNSSFTEQPGDGSAVNGTWDLLLDSTNGSWTMCLTKSQDSISGHVTATRQMVTNPTGRITGIIKKGTTLPILSLRIIPDSLTFAEATERSLLAFVRVEIDTFNMTFEGTITPAVNNGRINGWKRR